MLWYGELFVSVCSRWRISFYFLVYMRIVCVINLRVSIYSVVFFTIVYLVCDYYDYLLAYVCVSCSCNRMYNPMIKNLLCHSRTVKCSRVGEMPHKLESSWISLTIHAKQCIAWTAAGKVAIFWDVSPCSRCHLLHAGFMPCWFSALKMEAIHSSEMSVHIRTTRLHVESLLGWFSTLKMEMILPPKRRSKYGLHGYTLNSCSADFRPWRWKLYVASKQRFTHGLYGYTLVSCLDDFRPWRWKLYVPPKRRFTYRLHSAISQKMAAFITTAVRTADPTSCRAVFNLFCSRTLRCNFSSIFLPLKLLVYNSSYT
jgi:hypothetical protein